MEILVFLLGAGCVLLAVALIGHCLWLLGAAALRPLIDTPERQRAALQQQLLEMARSGSIPPEQFRQMIAVLHGRPLEQQRADIPAGAAATPSAEPAAQAAPPVQTFSPQARDVEAAETARSAEILEAEVEAVPGPPAPTHPLDRPAAPSGPPPAARRRRTLADVLQVFMEESNIRWIELIGGLLIVGGAVCLVVSIQATLSEAVPYFPALIFMLITAAIHGAGIYTLRRWNLQRTSRGVLIIGLLLVPLNFVAAIALSGEEPALAVTDPRFIGAVVVGLTAFTAMTAWSSRALVPGHWWLLTIAIIGTSCGQIVINRLGAPAVGALRVSALLALPVLSYLAGLLPASWRVLQKPQLTATHSRHLLLVLAISTFALLAPLGLLLSKSGEPRLTLAQMTPVLSLAITALLGTGLAVQQRSTSRTMATVRTTGTWIALVGAALFAAALVFAWPYPDLLIITGLINGALLILMATAGDLQLLHAGGVVCLALGYLMAFHQWQDFPPLPDRGAGRQLLSELLRARSSVALTAFVVLTAGISYAFNRARRRAAALAYLLGTGLVAGAVVAIALYAAYAPVEHATDHDLATVVLLTYALAGLVIAPRVGHAASGGLASALLLAGLVHLLSFNGWIERWQAQLQITVERPLLLAVLLHALATATAAMIARLRSPSPATQRGLIEPLGWLALIGSVLATPLVLIVLENQYLDHALYAACLAISWLCVAMALRWLPWLAAFQAMASIAIAYAALTISQHVGWWGGRFEQISYAPLVILALACWCALWSALRLTIGEDKAMGRVIRSPWLAIDSGVLAAVIVALVGLGIYVCAPGVMRELGEGVGEPEIAGFAQAGRYWWSVAAVIAALLVTIWQRRSWDVLAALLVALSAVPLFASAHFLSEGAVASALRWSFAFYTVATMGVLLARGQLSRFLPLLPDHQATGAVEHASGMTLQNIALALGILPVLGLTLAAVWQAAAGVHLPAPDPESIFAAMGPTFSYAGPLLLLVIVLVGQATCERSAIAMVGASSFFQLAVNLAFMLKTLTGVERPWQVATAELVEWNALALAAFALLWLSLRKWVEPIVGDDPEKRTARRLLLFQLSATIAAVGFLAAWAAVRVSWATEEFALVDAQLDSWLTYTAAIVCIIACGWFWRRSAAASVHWVTAAWLGGAALAALFAKGVAVDPWLSFHLLTGAWLATALALSAASCTARLGPVEFIRRREARWTNFVGGLVVLLACGTVLDDPWLWWPAASVGLAMLAFAVLAISRRSQSYAMTATILAAVATTLLWTAYLVPGFGSQQLLELLQLNLLTASVATLLWLLIDLYYQRNRHEALSMSARLRVHDVLPTPIIGFWTLLALAGFALTSGLRAAPRPADPLDVSNFAGASIAIVTGLLLLAVLWDLRAGRLNGLLLYLWGFLVLVLAIDQWEDTGLAERLLEVRPRLTVVLFALAAAAHVALAGALWKRRQLLTALAKRFDAAAPHAAFAGARGWLIVLQTLLAGLVVIVSAVCVLHMDLRWLRITAGFAPALAAVGLAALADHGRFRVWHHAALLLVTLSVVYLGWADMEPEWGAQLILTRAVRLLMALALVAFVEGVVLVRLVLSSANPWHNSVLRAAAGTAAAALVALLLVLGLEIAFFEPEFGAPLTIVQMIAVAVVLVGLVIALLSLAVLPGRDPLALSETGRTAYVYAAQAVSALLFLHIYLVEPEWFSGRIRPYWPYIIMAIAFAGVGAGELLRRKGIRVLAEPLERVGIFLPLLPALAFWVLVSENQLSYEANDISYPLILFMVSLLYLVATMLRPSYLTAFGAILAGNGALWALLASEGFAFFENPQLWLIPPALCVLLAAQLNRERLTPQQLTAARYASVIMIYLSSASEMFVAGIADSLWRPVVLALLSVSGVFAGIILHVRAFLYLGSSFLLLALVGMVWHASSRMDHAWPWFAFTMALGVAILVVFGIFEKRRSDVMRLIEQLRQWDQ